MNVSGRSPQKRASRASPINVLFNMVQKIDDYYLKKWMKGESHFWHRVIGRFVIKTVDFAVFTILMNADQDFTLSVSHPPAWSFGIRISRASFINIFGTVH